ncbi:MAG TPA: ribonucleoside-diphosphate reductase subunit alpha, partial [Patescibacteria group bacterium]|nr:ribonucleoside-diphosphate reductase subunit alpha [Patescibacteria group bacterium]
IANDVTVAINRSGRRRGATCVYLETWHADIEDFLELRKNTGDERRRTHDMNTANWVPDLFMKRVRDNSTWTLFSPDEVPELHDLYGKAFEEKYAVYEQKAKDGEIDLARTMKARDLWKKMLGMLFETGHPWITFKDPSNIRSPQDHVGVVHNSNLCTEITLNTSEKETAVCNLGSVNMAKHITDGKLNEELIKDTVLTAMRMLDNVVDINFYPTEEARAANMRHRPVGLGIMGFQDALYLMDISFDSEACVAFADRSMEVVSYYAILGSSLLAKERGAYESYKGSKWDRGLFPLDTINLVEQERGTKIDVARVETMEWRTVRDHVKQYGMRNSNTMAIAPTATISNIAGSVPTIEPIYKNIYVKSNISGDFTIVNHYLVEDLKRLRLWDDEMLGKIKYHDGNIQNITEIPETLRNKYKEVFQIDQRWLIRSAAYRGKWVDQSQSLNIYFAGTSGKEINDLYMYAWEMGLKTTYYLRTLAATQVEKSTVDTTKYGSTHLRKKEGETEAASPVATPQLETAQPLPQVMPVLQSSVVQTAAAQTAVAAVAGAGENAPKLCKILDPDCEACQ